MPEQVGISDVRFITNKRWITGGYSGRTYRVTASGTTLDATIR